MLIKRIVLLLLVCLILTSIVILLIIDHDTKKAQIELHNRQYDLLCNKIHLGMMKDDVLQVLKQVGDYSPVDDKYDVIRIVFLNDNLRNMYASFELEFKNDIYIASYVRGFDWVDNICDIYTANNTVTP